VAETSARPSGEPANKLEDAGGKAGTQTAPDTGSLTDVSSGGSPGEKADNMALFQAWLEKHKEYPQRAQLRHEEGTALLFLVVDRDGHVLDCRITQSSGHYLLDQEAWAMIERAQPLPPIPETMQAGRLELIVPVQFFSR
jgi:protein TonB